SRDTDALVGAATLAAARHDFRGALALALQARATARARLAAYPVLVDALVELGRYRAAERTLQALVDAKPNLAAYARVSYLRALVARLPLPEHVIGLGEAELAAGRRAAGLRDLALVGAEERLLQAAGVDTDAELAVFEADHGDRARAVARARRAWAAAPSIRS